MKNYQEVSPLVSPYGQHIRCRNLNPLTRGYGGILQSHLKRFSLTVMLGAGFPLTGCDGSGTVAHAQPVIPEVVVPAVAPASTPVPPAVSQITATSTGPQSSSQKSRGPRNMDMGGWIHVWSVEGFHEAISQAKAKGLGVAVYIKTANCDGCEAGIINELFGARDRLKHYNELIRGKYLQIVVRNNETIAPMLVPGWKPMNTHWLFYGLDFKPQAQFEPLTFVMQLPLMTSLPPLDRFKFEWDNSLKQ